MARLVINMDEGAVDLREFLELVLQRLGAVEWRRSKEDQLLCAGPLI